MTLHKSIFLLLLFLGLASCEKEAFEESLLPSMPQPFTIDHSKAAGIQAIMDEYTRKGVPGVVVAIKDEEGVWEGVSGYAKIETNQKLTPGFVHIGASLTKIYTAAAILKLKEQGLIELDKPFTQYLPTSVTAKITQANTITVRMLLNHTSGLPDFLENSTRFRLKWYNNLSKGWTTEEALSYTENKPLLFKPGSSFSYANVNYILLSLMINHLTGKEEGLWLKEALLDKLNLQRTYYKVQSEYLEKLPLPNYYMDQYGDGRLQNTTLAAKAEIRSELGDGGLVATAIDFVSFMDALMKGKVLSENSLAEMKTFGLGEYGLGLETGFNYLNQVQYGHMGAVLGGASMMLYFEKQKTSLYLSSNVDANLVGGKTLLLYHEMKNKISEYLAKVE